MYGPYRREASRSYILLYPFKVESEGSLEHNDKEVGSIMRSMSGAVLFFLTFLIPSSSFAAGNTQGIGDAGCLVFVQQYELYQKSKNEQQIIPYREWLSGYIVATQGVIPKVPTSVPIDYDILSPLTLMDGLGEVYKICLKAMALPFSFGVSVFATNQAMVFVGKLSTVTK